MSSESPSYQSAASLLSVAQEYLPANFPLYNNTFSNAATDFVNEKDEEYVQRIMDVSDNPLKIFGTATDLAKNFAVFRDFSFSHLYNQIGVCEPYWNTPAILTTSKNEEVMRLTDFFAMLQNMVLEKFNLTGNKLARAYIACYLKTNELKRGKWWEFMISAQKRQSIENGLESLQQNIKKEIENNKHSSILEKHTFCEIIEKLGSVLPEPLNQYKHFVIFEFLNQLCATKDPLKNQDFYSELVYTLQEIVYYLCYWGTMPWDMSPLVYTFEDGRKTVLLNNDKNTRFFETVPLEQEDLDQAETVNIPLIRAKHRVVPILTPSGVGCKPAVDVLLENLQDMFFGFQIFQKIRKSEWKDVEFYFTHLQAYFDCQKKSLYFISLDDIKNIQSATESYFSEVFNRPTKEFRSLKQNKLNAEILKKELSFLGVVDALPGISGYVKEALEHVQKGKNQKDMKTSDLADAMWFCLLKSLCEKIPFLKEFFYHQNCPLSPALSISPTTSNLRFQNTCFRDVQLSEISVTGSERLLKASIRLNANNLHIDYNKDACDHVLHKYAFCLPRETKEREEVMNMREKDWDMKPFLVDSEQYEITLSEVRKIPNIYEKAKGSYAEFQSIEAFQKVNNPSHFYLRYFSTTVYNKTEDRRVFAEEVLDLVSVILRKQGVVLDDSYHEKMAEYQKKYPVGCNKTISMPQLQNVLNDFDVNKELLTIVPDMHYAECVMKKVVVKPGCPVIWFPSPSKQKVMDISQAHFHIFQSVICDVDWRKEVCTEPENSVENFRELVVSEMRNLRLLGDVVLYEDVRNSIEKLKNHPNYIERQERKLLTTLIKLYDADFNDTVPLSFFYSECQTHGIPCFQPPGTSKKQLDSIEIPAWKARLLFQQSWMSLFFGGVENAEDIEKSVLKAWLYKVPIKNWNQEGDFMNLILDLDPQLFKRAGGIAVSRMCSIHESKPSPISHDWLKDEAQATRSYINRCVVSQDIDLLEVQVKKVRARNQEEEQKTMEILRQMIGEQSKVRIAIRELFRAEDLKFFGVDKPQQAARMRDLKNTLRFCVKAKESESQKEEEIETEQPERSTPCSSTSEAPTTEVSEVLEASTSEKKPLESCQNCAKGKKKQEGQRKEINRLTQLLEKSKITETVPITPPPAPAPSPPPPLPSSQKESACCPKCLSTSERCKAATKQKDAALNENEKLKKKLEKYEEREKGENWNKPRVQMEKELDEFSRRQEEWKKKEQEMQERIERLEREAQMSKETIDKLSEDKSKLECRNSQNEIFIKTLRTAIPTSTLSNLHYELPLEMKRILVDLQSKFDDVRAQDFVGKANTKVVKLIQLTDDGTIKERANLAFVQFNLEFQKYEEVLERSIDLIQKTPFLTLPELPDVPELPDLPKEFYNVFKKVQDAKNKELDNECVICFKPKQPRETWFTCTSCPKKFHRSCIAKCFNGEKTIPCPHCTVLMRK